MHARIADSVENFFGWRALTVIDHHHQVGSVLRSDRADDANIVSHIVFQLPEFFCIQLFIHMDHEI